MSIISAGTKFGLITVTGAPESRRNGVYYECQCDCGADLIDVLTGGELSRIRLVKQNLAKQFKAIKEAA